MPEWIAFTLRALAQRRKRVWTPNVFQRDRLILVEKQKNTFQKKSTWPPRFSPFKILDFLGHEATPQNLVLLRSQELLGVSRRPIAQNDRTGANQNQFAISRLFHSCQFAYSNFYVFFVIFSVTKWSLDPISLSKWPYWWDRSYGDNRGHTHSRQFAENMIFRFLAGFLASRKGFWSL